MVDRFVRDLAAVRSGEGQLGLAVSGGPDSLALLLLASHAIASHFEAATVDHGLRAASSAEAERVAAVCAERGIPHRTLTVEISRTGNLQANARAGRYRALAQWAGERRLGAIVTAHHLDDQAETLLMRLARGAGVRGLAAMRPRSTAPGSACPLLRPLLAWRRTELARLVEQAGLVPVADPSNDDPRFERAALRRRLEALEWLDPVALAASASHLADADAALDWAAGLEDLTAGEDGRSWLYRPQGPRAVRLRVIERIVGGSPRGNDVARLLETLEAGGIATLGTFKAEALADGCWRFTRVPPHRGGN